MLQRVSAQVPVSWGPALGGDSEAGQISNAIPDSAGPTGAPAAPHLPFPVFPALVPQQPGHLVTALPPVSHPSWTSSPLGCITGQSDMVTEDLRPEGISTFAYISMLYSLQLYIKPWFWKG